MRLVRVFILAILTLVCILLLVYSPSPLAILLGSANNGGEMSDAQLFQQMAFLNWLQTQGEKQKETLVAVTGIQVARELMNRQGKIDAYKDDLQSFVNQWNVALIVANGCAASTIHVGMYITVCSIHEVKRQCIQSIVAFVQRNPRTSQMEINTEVEKHALVFAARVKALGSALIL